MLISRLLRAIDIVYKNEDADIKFITDDSRKCTEDSVFVCDKSSIGYVKDALERGARLVVSEQSCELCDCIVVPDARKAYALLCSELFENAHRSLKIIAITGTNGKTTTAGMLYAIMSAAGKKCGLISTVENIIDDKKAKASLTTPGCFELHRLFYEIKASGGEYCIMEASSQGLEQQRLYGVTVDTGIFTNLTEDHLDFHKSLEGYRAAKLSLFSCCRKAVINADDELSADIEKQCKGKCITYSLSLDSADYTAKCIKSSENITDYAIVGDSLIHRIRLQVPGEFNISNSMAAIACAYEYGVGLEQCAAALRSFSGVRGRMELLNINKPFRVIIDYAHTPDGIKQALLSLRSFSRNRVITVFGCGGDREKEKRLLMGQIVAEYSDMAIVTSDNPRSEEPEDIIDDILAGMKKSRIPVYIQKNRAKAISYALKTAKENDIILLCGKGHEDYQLTGDKKIPWDEREIVMKALDEL